MAAEALSPDILRPIPRRPFEPLGSSVGSSACSTPGQASAVDADPRPEGGTPAGLSHLAPSRERSLLNLTSSTLFGIYSPAATQPDRDEPPTPPSGHWASSSSLLEVPRRTTSHEAFLDLTKPARAHRNSSSYAHNHSQFHGPGHLRPGQLVLSFSIRIVLLFLFGVAYGVIITHLHDSQKLAPVEIVGVHSFTWSHLLFWGVAGVALGSLLPWVDMLLEGTKGNRDDADGRGESAVVDDEDDAAKRHGRNTTCQVDGTDEATVSTRTEAFSPDWNAVVRSIGAFVGIAFAIRKLPWQSTLQASLTLALVNPVLWYIIDRSKPGLVLSSVVGLTGTAVLLGTNPGIVPAPAPAAGVLPPRSSSSSSSMASGASSAFSTVSSTIISAAVSSAAASPNGNTSYPPPQTSSTSFLVSPASWMGGYVTPETIGVTTWIASVLFCSCVCFGNIGRRLALDTNI